MPTGQQPNQAALSPEETPTAPNDRPNSASRPSRERAIGERESNVGWPVAAAIAHQPQPQGAPGLNELPAHRAPAPSGQASRSNVAGLSSSLDLLQPLAQTSASGLSGAKRPRGPPEGQNASQDAVLQHDNVHQLQALPTSQTAGISYTSHLPATIQAAALGRAQHRPDSASSAHGALDARPLPPSSNVSAGTVPVSSSTPVQQLVRAQHQQSSSYARPGHAASSGHQDVCTAAQGPVQTASLAGDPPDISQLVAAQSHASCQPAAATSQPTAASLPAVSAPAGSQQPQAQQPHYQPAVAAPSGVMPTAFLSLQHLEQQQMQAQPHLLPHQVQQITQPQQAQAQAPAQPGPHQWPMQQQQQQLQEHYLQQQWLQRLYQRQQQLAPPSGPAMHVPPQYPNPHHPVSQHPPPQQPQPHPAPSPQPTPQRPPPQYPHPQYFHPQQLLPQQLLLQQLRPQQPPAQRLAQADGTVPEAPGSVHAHQSAPSGAQGVHPQQATAAHGCERQQLSQREQDVTPDALCNASTGAVGAGQASPQVALMLQSLPRGMPGQLLMPFPASGMSAYAGVQPSGHRLDAQRPMHMGLHHAMPPAAQAGLPLPPARSPTPLDSAPSPPPSATTGATPLLTPALSAGAPQQTHADSAAPGQRHVSLPPAVNPALYQGFLASALSSSWPGTLPTQHVTLPGSSPGPPPPQESGDVRQGLLGATPASAPSPPTSSGPQATPPAEQPAVQPAVPPLKEAAGDGGEGGGAPLATAAAHAGVPRLMQHFQGPSMQALASLDIPQPTSTSEVVMLEQLLRNLDQVQHKLTHDQDNTATHLENLVQDMLGRSAGASTSSGHGSSRFIADAHRALLKSTNITQDLHQNGPVGTSAPAPAPSGPLAAGEFDEAVMKQIREAAHAAAAAADPQLAIAALAPLAPTAPARHEIAAASEPTQAVAAKPPQRSPSAATAPAAIADSAAAAAQPRPASSAHAAAVSEPPLNVQESGGGTAGAASNAAALWQSSGASAARSGPVEASSRAAPRVVQAREDAPSGGTDESGATWESGSVRTSNRAVASASAGVSEHLEASLLLDGSSAAPRGPPPAVQEMLAPADETMVATSQPQTIPQQLQPPQTASNWMFGVHGPAMYPGAAQNGTIARGLRSGQSSVHDVPGSFEAVPEAGVAALAHGDARSGDVDAVNPQGVGARASWEQEQKAAAALSSQRPESHAAGAMQTASTAPDESAQGSHAPGLAAVRHSVHRQPSRVVSGGEDGGTVVEAGSGAGGGSAGAGGGVEGGSGDSARAMTESSRPAQQSVAQPPQRSSEDAVEGAAAARADAAGVAVDPRVGGGGSGTAEDTVVKPGPSGEGGPSS